MRCPRADGAARAIVGRRSAAQRTACGSARSFSGDPMKRPSAAGAGMSATAMRDAAVALARPTSSGPSVLSPPPHPASAAAPPSAARLPISR